MSWLANRRALGRCARVGHGVRIEGAVRIPKMAGTIELGDGVVVQSLPFVTELKAGGARARLRIGEDVHISYGCMILAEYTAIEIGAGTVIGPMTRIVDTNYHDPDTMKLDLRPRPITIGKRVRVSAWSIIAKGTVIEDDVTVHAGAVVAGRIRAGTEIAGNPARDIAARKAFGAETDAETELERLRRFLADELALENLPPPETAIGKLANLDSLARVMMMGALEDLFGITIPFGADWRSMTPARLVEWKRTSRG